MKLNPHTLDIAVQRELGLRGNLHDFAKMAWSVVEPGSPFIDGWHIHEVCEHLEAVSHKQIMRLIINIPPGCMKSLNVSVFWPVWHWLHYPSDRYIYSSYDASLTRAHGNKRLQILHSDWFKRRWGDKVIVPATAAAGEYYNQMEGFHYSTSVGGRVTGRHGDIQVADDPIKPLDISKNSLAMTLEWWRGTMASRFRDPATGRKVIIMQRLHENDLAGAMMKEGGYEVLKLPMRYEPKTRCFTSIGGDKRTEPGELLWPEHIDEHALCEIEKGMGGRGSLVATAQLDQNPSPAGGAIFKRDWVKRWAKLPTTWASLTQSWDLTFKGAATSDYVSGQLWGRSGADFYLLDEVHERLNFPETIEAIKDFTRRWPKATMKLVEEQANGAAVIATLEKDIPGIVPVKPQGGKEARANAVAPLWEAGNVYLPPEEGHPWVADYIEELVTFPRATHDDRVDAMTQALFKLYTSQRSFGEAMRMVRERGLLR